VCPGGNEGLDTLRSKNIPRLDTLEVKVVVVEIIPQHWSYTPPLISSYRRVEVRSGLVGISAVVIGYDIQSGEICTEKK
jgi:hypothetical protein